MGSGPTGSVLKTALEQARSRLAGAMCGEGRMQTTGTSWPRRRPVYTAVSRFTCKDASVEASQARCPSFSPTRQTFREKKDVGLQRGLGHPVVTAVKYRLAKTRKRIS